MNFETLNFTCLFNNLLHPTINPRTIPWINLPIHLINMPSQCVLTFNGCFTIESFSIHRLIGPMKKCSRTPDIGSITNDFIPIHFQCTRWYFHNCSACLVTNGEHSAVTDPHFNFSAEPLQMPISSWMPPSLPPARGSAAPRLRKKAVKFILE